MWARPRSQPRLPLWPEGTEYRREGWVADRHEEVHCNTHVWVWSPHNNYYYSFIHEEENGACRAAPKAE
jgi:hypothetical protein